MNLEVNIKRCLCFITDIVIITQTILGIVCIFQITILNKKYVNIFDYTAFRVATGSMKNEINTNDIIFVKLTKEVNEKDVIAFEQDEELIVHRVISKTKDYIITKGDANNYTDEPIKEEQVIGKVVKKISSNFLVKFIITVIILSLIIYLISKIVKGKQTNERIKV